ncbi:hypothetical protein EW145_g7901 [Phellinidium pouzarii]|uniref:BTB domain-containing protein n=1 Tax=Phellinidium pouzarii TaxID=167371 RepID=A0A4S4KCH6_9AGAM|nr:hypothetical protein EW145_g7901 [Phellinidium pouzarii]
MLSLPAPSGRTQEGASEENPIHLPQVTAADFEKFLWVFYNPKHSVYDAPLDTWTVILELAHRWQFSEIRQLAFRELDLLPVPPVTRVVLTDRYDALPTWRAKALAELGARPEPLTIAEGEQLGLEKALKVAELRERIRGRDSDRRLGHEHYQRRYERSRSPRRATMVSPIYPQGSTGAPMAAYYPVRVPTLRSRSPSPPESTPNAPVAPSLPYVPYVPPQQDIHDVRAIFGLE